MSNSRWDYQPALLLNAACVTQSMDCLTYFLIFICSIIIHSAKWNRFLGFRPASSAMITTKAVLSQSSHGIWALSTYCYYSSMTLRICIQIIDNLEYFEEERWINATEWQRMFLVTYAPCGRHSIAWTEKGSE